MSLIDSDHKNGLSIGSVDIKANLEKILDVSEKEGLNGTVRSAIFTICSSIKIDLNEVISKVKKQGLEVAARTFAYSLDPNMIIIAGKIEALRIQLETPSSFSEAMKKLEFKLQPKFSAFISRNAEELNSIIKPERDFTYSFFAMKTLQKGYLASTKDGIIVSSNPKIKRKY